MKPKLCFLLAAGLILAAVVGSRAASSYTITSSPGWNLIANQLDSPNGNAIQNVLPAVNIPLGSQLMQYNLATKSFGLVETRTTAVGGGPIWSPGTTVLNITGAGIYFSNASAANLNMTINGIPHVPVLPLNIGSNVVLVARQTNDLASVTNILGFAPPNFTIVYRFLPGTGHDPNVFSAANYTIHVLKGGAWTTPPGPPVNIPVGESVWISTNGSLPVIASQPKDQTICLGGTARFNVSATGTPPLTYQWFQNSNSLAGATSNDYTVANAGTNNLGNYFAVVSNPFGATTSSVAVLAFGDVTPPTLSCPNDFNLPCSKPEGTPLFYQVSIVDNCDTNPLLICSPPAGTLVPPGQTTVTCFGKDASGNTNTCSFIVTVIDDVAPTIVCPSNSRAIATSPAGAKVFYSASATDNCDPNPSIVCVPPSGSTFAIGVTDVTCFAKDSSGNSRQCTFTVRVLAPACCDYKVWTQAPMEIPPARAGHSMAYDSRRGRVVLFGGLNGTPLGDTWEWDGTTWLQVAASGPPARYWSALSYDVVRGVCVLCDGYGTNGFLSDTWEWDGAQWHQVAVTSPPARAAHAMVYDSSRRRTVLFGGLNTAFLNDTWEYNGSQWLLVPTNVPAPPIRAGHAMAYDRTRKQTVLFAGAGPGSLGVPGQNTIYRDTWSWDGSNWVFLTASGPSPRFFSAMDFDTSCSRVLLFGGGSSATNISGETWEWDGANWGLKSSSGPQPRSEHAMAYDSGNGQSVMYGGIPGAQGILGDTWLWDFDTSPPAVLSAYIACQDTNLVITFSKPVDPASATNAATYSFSCGASSPVILNISLSEDQRIVTLTLDRPVGGCSLLIFGLRDVCGNFTEISQRSFECRPEPCLHGNRGLEYWLTFPGNYAPDPANPPQPQLFIAGTSGTIGSVALPGLVPPFTTSFTIPASGVATVNLPKAADLANANDLIGSNGVHVVASARVSVYGMNHIPYTTDAYLGLPKSSLGRAYLVMSYQNVYTNVPELNGSQLAIVATEDNSIIAIVPSATVGTHPAGVPFLFTMMRGQTYQLRDTNGAPADLTGTIVVSDHPIGVFGSHQCASVPGPDVFFCDHLVEQMWPTELWGTEFVTMPLAGRTGGDTFRIMALYPGTTVNRNGAPLAGPLGLGQFVEVVLNGPSWITANAPVLVAQFANSADFDPVTPSYADPFMVLVPPTSMFGTSSTVAAPTVDFPVNYLNVAASPAAVGSVTLDGSVIAPGTFAPISASGYLGVQLFVGPGAHTLSTAAGTFDVIAYGWSVYDAYGYPGGYCAPSNQRPPPRFTCPPTNLVVQSDGCLTPIPDLKPLVGNGPSALIILQDPPANTLVAPGQYLVTTTIIDAQGNRQICQTLVQVILSGSGLQCPNDIVTRCTSPQGAVVTYIVGLCNTNFTVQCNPPSGSLFAPGTTPVSCMAGNALGVIDKCGFNVTVTCVRLGITQNGNNVTIAWPGGGVLQKGTNILGPWIPVPNASNTFTISISGPQAFFRLVQ